MDNKEFKGRSVCGLILSRCSRMALLLCVCGIASCGGGGGSEGDLPKGFASMTDAAKVEYMMKHVSPDSVARFLCDAALGRTPGVKIDTLSMATLYAYENYKDDDLQTFSIAYDSYAEALPLPDKMQLRKLGAQDDPMGLGYQLGLEYVNSIRIDNKNAAAVESEIKALQDLCAKSPEDSLTFKRFMKGFKIALDMDGSEGVPMEIYNKYK